MLRKRTSFFVAVIASLGALAVVPAAPAAAQGGSEPSAAQRCFEHHEFGAQPVDVAKSADRQTVLAQVSWGYHDAIGCYLTLDDTALAVLQAAPAPQSLPDAETEASKLCFEHHQFGQRPVDVAKTADRQTILARLSWGHHPSIGCYLTLDDTALTTLRTAAAPPPSGTAATIAVAVNPWDVSFGNLDIDVCALEVSDTVNCWLWVWHLNHTGQFGGWVPQAQKTVGLGEPVGQFTTILAAKHSTEFCGIKADQSVACWFNEYGWWNRNSLELSRLVELDAPTGQFKAISMTSEDDTHGDSIGYKGVACGVRISGAAACWSWELDWDSNKGYVLVERDVPDGPFIDISISNSVSDGLTSAEVVGCGIKVGGAVSCWAWGTKYNIEKDALIYDALYELEAPVGSFTAFASPDSAPDSDSICGLGTSGGHECWAWECDYGIDDLVCSQTALGDGYPKANEGATPSGQFSTVLYINDIGACGVRVDGAVQCWSYQLGDDGNGYPVGLVDQILEIFDLNDPTR